MRIGRRAARLIFHVIVIVIVLLARNAGAQQPATDPEKLFTEGSALMEQGKYEEALPKLEQAQKADPGIGTMFNIAVCHQKLGRLGTAYREFREVTTLARAAGKKAREDAARAKLDEVKTVAPAFSIRVATDAHDTEVTVRIDGEPLKKEDWAFYPVDPGGEHRIEANASSKKPWSKMVPTPAAGKVEEIAIPTLEVAKDTKVVTVTTSDSRKTLGYIFGGIGIAGAITAGVTGVMLLSADSTAEEKCPNKVCRNPDGTQNKEGADAVSLGSTLLPINAIAWGVAAVGIGAGAFFLLTSGSKPEAKTAKTAKIRPMVGLNSVGVVGVF